MANLNCSILFECIINIFLSLILNISFFDFVSEIKVFFSSHKVISSEFFGIINLKVLPTPNSLLTSILHESIFANSFEIARPRPVPPNFLVLESSTCLNLVKIFSISEFSIPIPVSITSISILFSNSNIFI